MLAIAAFGVGLLACELVYRTLDAGPRWPVVAGGFACVGLLYPALLYWGAEAVERAPRLGALLGDASFAIYAVHRPLMELLSGAHLHHGIALQTGSRSR